MVYHNTTPTPPLTRYSVLAPLKENNYPTITYQDYDDYIKLKSLDDEDKGGKGITDVRRLPCGLASKPCFLSSSLRLKKKEPALSAWRNFIPSAFLVRPVDYMTLAISY